MRKIAVLKHFDPEGMTLMATATVLGISKQAVSQWGDIVPEAVAYKLQVITAGRLRVDPALYARQHEPRPAA